MTLLIAAACSDHDVVSPNRGLSPRGLNRNSAAGFTSVDENDGPGHCLNASPVNCNLYDGKEFVWLNGGPIAASLGAGQFFFAVLEPGGQADPNDGTSKNLSVFDTYENRTFNVDGSGNVTYGGTHLLDGDKIRLMDYADTHNGGGVYIMAICKYTTANPTTGTGAPGVDPKNCKYDAFKIQSGDDTGGELAALTIIKDASGAYDNKYAWTMAKSVDKTLVKQVGGKATFNYTLVVTKDGGTISNVAVTGKISVFNPNIDNDGNTIPVDITAVTDELSVSGTTCTVTNGGAQTLSQFQTDFNYSCPLTSKPSGDVNNTADVAWNTQTVGTQTLTGGAAHYEFQKVGFTENTINDCADVTDTFGGSLGNTCASKTYNYSHDFNVPASGCQSYDNTATVTPPVGDPSSDTKSVTVCGPVASGALTIGFWQNKNGQGIISGSAATANVCNVGTWLRTFAPFQDLIATAKCSVVATYVSNVIGAATCTSSSQTCNSMLKAQMLATALDVYFSDPALGGNKIGAFNGKGNSQAPIGPLAIDLTKICFPINSGGSCGGYVDASSAFGGASSKTVLEILTYAASQSNAGGTNWYGQLKATQVLAKDVFDAINNQVAFAP